MKRPHLAHVSLTSQTCSFCFGSFLEASACMCACMFIWCEQRPLCAIKVGLSKCDSSLMDNDKVADELVKPFPLPMGKRQRTVWCHFNSTQPWKINIKAFRLIRPPFEIAYCARCESENKVVRVGGCESVCSWEHLGKLYTDVVPHLQHSKNWTSCFFFDLHQ